MTRHQYYRDGTEISEAEALDHRGLLRDQTTMRVRTTMRDSPTLWAQADPRGSSFGSTGFAKDRIGFTDGSGDPWSASRPGFRVRVGDKREAVQDAYRRYENELVNRWRLGDEERTCSACDGSGEDEAGNDCPVCGGEGVLPAATDTHTAHASLAQRNDDSRPLAQRMQDHKRTMDALYRARDAELENAWRNK